MFCPELQKLLKPIYDLTKKGGQFIWGKEQQDAFKEIKHRLVKPPVLHMLTLQVDSIYILIQGNMPQEVHCIKYRMESPS